MVEKGLNQEQSGRTGKFAEILAKATTIFGSQERAEQWLEKPATGLNQRRPIDLLSTPAGVELVEDFLERLEYGVYTWPPLPPPSAAPTPPPGAPAPRPTPRTGVTT